MKREGPSAPRRARAGRRVQAGPELSLWREALAGLDWVSLRTSAVYHGFRIPHGDGSPVVLVPFFLGSDRYLMEMFYWLQRIGYKPYRSAIGRNADCPDLLLGRLVKTVDRAFAETGEKVRLVGHSLGGTIARAAAARRPRRVAQVITLGSPIRSARVHPTLLAATSLVRSGLRRSGRQPPGCYTELCTCSFVSSLEEALPASVGRAAIYTKSDGIIDWRCCLDEDPAVNIQVKGTHVGLAFNPEVYRAVALLLATGKPA